jgi:hypothetical protein
LPGTVAVTGFVAELPPGITQVGVPDTELAVKMLLVVEQLITVLVEATVKVGVAVSVPTAAVAVTEQPFTGSVTVNE